MNALKAKLASLKRIAEGASDPERYRPFQTGLRPDCMRSMGILGSHNRTPYVNDNDADFIFASRTALPLLLEVVEKLVEGMEQFQLNHEHAPGLPHIRVLGDSYGWCDFCNTKMGWGEDDARDILAEVSRILGVEK